MITVQILTKNNAGTIKKTLDSINDLDCQILIGDLGSSDETLDICSSYKTKIINLKWQKNYSVARNQLIQDGFNFYIEPWEVLVSGFDEFLLLDNSAYVYVINNGIVSKEIRLWSDLHFKNPVYETIIDKSAQYKPNIVLVSGEPPDNRDEKIEIVKKWSFEKPTLSDPYYYLACSYLSKRMYKEFFNYANQYLIMENNKISTSSIMLFYYMAQINLHIGMLKEATDNILNCITVRPCMSEFWCLLGDIMYKQQKYEKAKIMYENAIIIGKRRKQNDEYPIEISKYNKYPNFMIDNIKSIKEKIGIIIKK